MEKEREERMIDYMPTKNASETIEALARKLERVRILNDLKSCQDNEEIQEYIKMLEQQVEEDRKN